MDSTSSRFRARTAAHFTLLGSASLLALATGTAFAQPAGVPAAPGAAVATAAPVEEVLITGSLIVGGAAVGVPVTALSQEAFKETGALTVTEMLRTVPALTVQETTNAARGGGTIGYGQSVSIHGFAPGSGVETLMLINGKRWPVQGHGGDTVDPSIIPQLAIQRVDVLAAGASAVYGSDAVGGVINVILRRNFNGAITQGQYGASTDIGNQWFQFAQLWGTTWDSGGITLSYEYYHRQHVDGAARSYYTTNFEPYGLSDQTPLANSVPGVITTGNPVTVPNNFGFVANVGTRFCGNCYSVPDGTGWNFGAQAPGPTVSWQQVLNNPGVNNQRNPYIDAYINPDQQRNAATMTFDQDLAKNVFGLADVSLFVDANYSNRRAMQNYHATGSGNAQQFLSPNNGWTIPTNNPYRPSGVPAGQVVRVHYTMGAEMPNTISGGEIATRWSTGFNFDNLPGDWHGNAYYSMTDDHNFAYGRNMINSNMFLAALGNTVPAAAANGTIPGQQAFVKPANIPYLNILCDSSVYKCNSPQTLKYISAFRDQDERWQIAQFGMNLNGPVLDLPGGTVMGAISYEKQSHNWHFFDIENRNPHNTAIISNNREFAELKSEALFGQLDIPLVGEGFTLPGVQGLLLSLGYRYDQYNNFGGVQTPKVAANWDVGYGLTFRGAWGKSFRAPSFQEYSSLSGTRILGINAPAGGSFNSAYQLNCAAVPGVTGSQGVAQAGSLTALLNPTCSTTDALVNQGALQISGGSGAAVAIRGSNNLGPQKVKQWSVGANFAPTEGFLQGLNLDVSYFKITGNDIIGTNNSGTGVNDANSISRYIVIPNPSQLANGPGNEAFWAILQELSQNGSFTTDPALLPNVKYIEDNANQNIGSVDFAGIDWDTRYDWDMGNLGAWNIGASGYYELQYSQKSNPLAPADDRYEGKNSGHQMKRIRGRLGWTDGSWSITNFVRWYGHGEVNINTIPPRCYWADGFASGACYPGSPYNDQPSNNFYGNRSPSMTFWDLTIAYNTGDNAVNNYLKNVEFSLAINNVLNKAPPFQFRDRGRGRDWTAFDPTYGELQRVVSFTVTKTW